MIKLKNNHKKNYIIKKIISNIKKYKYFFSLLKILNINKFIYFKKKKKILFIMFKTH